MLTSLSPTSFFSVERITVRFPSFKSVHEFVSTKEFDDFLHGRHREHAEKVEQTKSPSQLKQNPVSYTVKGSNTVLQMSLYSWEKQKYFFQTHLYRLWHIMQKVTDTLNARLSQSLKRISFQR